MSIPPSDLQTSPPQRGKVVLGEPVHSHQVDVRVLFPLELFPAHVARSVHVQLHVRVKLERKGIAGFIFHCVFGLDK